MTFNELLAEKEAIETRLKEINSKSAEVAREEFKVWAKDLFERYPALETISWTQYTPYFNDGDPCYFRSSHEYCSINSEESEYFDRSEFAEEGANKLEEEVSKFLGKFDDDDMERLFGDHVKVTITKSGIDVDEYSHD